jgi:hypothetical protein
MIQFFIHLLQRKEGWGPGARSARSPKLSFSSGVQLRIKSSLAQLCLTDLAWGFYLLLLRSEYFFKLWSPFIPRAINLSLGCWKDFYIEPW